MTEKQHNEPSVVDASCVPREFPASTVSVGDVVYCSDADEWPHCWVNGLVVDAIEPDRIGRPRASFRCTESAVLGWTHLCFYLRHQGEPNREPGETEFDAVYPTSTTPA